MAGASLPDPTRASLAAWLEARHGRLWENGLEGLESYNRVAKVEPMQRALRDLNARAWLAGLRRDQASTREKLPVAIRQGDQLKILVSPTA